MSSSRSHKTILVAERSSTFESVDLQRAAKEAGIPLVVADISADMSLPENAKDAGLVYWRSSSLTTKYAKNVGRVTFLTKADSEIKVLNRAIIDTPQYVYKSVQQARAQKFLSGIKPVKTIPTFMASDAAMLRDHISAGRLVFPFIAKPNLGRRGEGVILIEKENDIETLTGDLSELIFQNFIKNNGDWRVFVIGGKAHDIMLRSATARSTRKFLNNISQGGQATRVTDEALRAQLAKAGTSLAAIFGYTICGVDLIADEDGQVYFLEINSAPEWKGLSSVSPRDVGRHIVDTLSFVADGRLETDDIFTAVRDYWLQHIEYLPVNLQFHFLSRLHLWSGKQKYRAQIDAIRADWWGDMSNVEKALVDVKDHFDEKRSYKSYRQAALMKHFPIETYNRLFFKCLFDRTIFGGSQWEEYKERLDIEHLRETRDNLLRDTAAVLTLSTAAVNFLYFCDYFLGESEDMAIDPGLFLSIARTESLPVEADDIDARLYMLTHAIIGATRFYHEPIPLSQRDIYHEMLAELEKLVQIRYSQMSLDHKCEFLVCCRLAGYETELSTIIRSELESSLAADGAYFINRHNVFQDRLETRTLIRTEHSNALALMAFLDGGVI